MQTGTGPTKTARQLLKKLDLLGTFFLFPAIVCLLLALEWGGSKYPWNDWSIVVLLYTFAVAICLWAYVQYRLGDNATVPLRIARMRSMGAGMWVSFCISGVVSWVVQYVPIWFQAVRSTSAYQSGINFLPATGAQALLAVMSGFFVSLAVCPSIIPCPATNVSPTDERSRVLGAADVLLRSPYLRRNRHDL